MAETKRVLILGGTTEAYLLARRLSALKVDVITSLAGRTKDPRLPLGRHRIGGFGGVFGLIDYLTSERISYVIDATHPFAHQITENAIRATKDLGLGYLRLERPIWPQQKGDDWRIARSEKEAAWLIPENSRCFLALGRQHLTAFTERCDVTFYARMIEQSMVINEFKNLKVILALPGNESEELTFLRKHCIDVMVCRNSGGTRSYGKIKAARRLNIPVIMIERKPLLQTAIVSTVGAALDEVSQLFKIPLKPCG